MAATAIGTKAAIMNVLVAVAAATQCCGIRGITARLVTAIAGEISVCAQQGISGMFFVVELPQVPGVGCMAILTPGAQGAFVMIVRFMTADTVGCGPDKLAFQMTALTGDDLMHANQRKLCKIMVKAEYGRPPFGNMASRADLHFGLLVNVVGGMTGRAIPR